MIPYHTTQVEIYKLYSFEYFLASWGLSVIKKNWKKKRVSWVKNSQIRFWYPHFDVTCDLLLNWLNGNVTFPLFVLYNKEPKKIVNGHLHVWPPKDQREESIQIYALPGYL